MTPRIKVLLAGAAVLGALVLWGSGSDTPAVTYAAGPRIANPCATAQILSRNIQPVTTAGGFTVSTLGGNGYILLMGQFGTRGVMDSPYASTILAAFMVMAFTLRLPDGTMPYGGFLLATRHGSSLTLCANALLSSTFGIDGRLIVGPHMVGLRLHGTIFGVRRGRDGSLIGTRGRLVIDINVDGQRRTYWVDGVVGTHYGPAYVE